MYFVILCMQWLLVLLSAHIFRRKIPIATGLRHRHLPVMHARPAPPRRSGGKPKPAFVIDEVLEIYATCRGLRKTEMEFNRRHGASGVTVCPNTVRNYLRRYASDMLKVQQASRHRVPDHLSANRCWAIDATGKVDDSGRQHCIFGVIDCGTRACLLLTRMPLQTSDAFLRELQSTMQMFGKPKFIRSDNASVFRCTEFRHALKVANVQQVFSTPGKPWQNGRIERLFLTLKEQLNLLIPANGDTLDQLLNEFRYFYNEARPHQHLHGWTPMEAWRGTSPYVRAPAAVTRYEGWNGQLKGFIHRR